MPVKLVVNGYFRSGTTAVWELLKQNNCNSIVFYEPCHEKLPLILDVVNDEEDVLHGKKLWNEYFENKIYSSDIRKVHPNLGVVHPSESRKVLEYTNIYHELAGDVVLQTNRWHEYLYDIHKEYDAVVVHLIRNPIDIYASFEESLFKNRKGISLLKAYVLRYFFREDVFYVDEAFKFLKHRSAKGEDRYRGIYRKIYLKLYSRFERFMYAWIIFNYQALIDCKKSGGFVAVYENLGQGDLANYLALNGYSFDESLLKPNRLDFIDKEEMGRLSYVARKIGLESEFEYIFIELGSGK